MNNLERNADSFIKDINGSFEENPESYENYNNVLD